MVDGMPLAYGCLPRQSPFAREVLTTSALYSGQRGQGHRRLAGGGDTIVDNLACCQRLWVPPGQLLGGSIAGWRLGLETVPVEA